HYEYRTSTDGGTTWSAPTVGADASITADGETLVQFRSVDAAGNASDWAPAGPDDGSTVRLDRTIPTSPIVTGGTDGWQNVASADIGAASSTDTGGSGLTGYQYQTSTDGGTTWSSPAAGSADLVTIEGETLVQLRAIDGAGNTSAWVQGTARIDRTLP